MQLKSKVASLNDVDEKYHELYAERNGAYFLNVDESAGINTALRALNEEREQRKALAARLKSFEDFDLKGYKEYQDNKDNKDKSQSKSTNSNGDYQALLDEKIAEVSKQLGAQIESLKQEREEAQRKLNNERISSMAQAAAAKFNAHPTALPDISVRVASKFKIEDNNNVVSRQDGVIELDKEGKPLTVESYVENLRAGEASHLFKTSEGSGITRSGSRFFNDGIKVVSAGESRNAAILNNLKDIASGKAVIGE